MTPARAQELAKNFLKKDYRALARLITLVENKEKNIEQALAKIYPHTGHAHLVGITGPPGAGKSTLTDKVILQARQKDLSVGVICVDPSSPFTGGAILGDRIRMQAHANDAKVFIRSIGTRGGQGGLSRSTQEVAMLLDAFGFDLVILETAGVGQTELGILGVAHTTIVVLVPESGDDIQMMKAGILEIADLLVVNKCDRQGSDHIVKELQVMLELGPAGSEKPWQIPVMKTAAERNEGITEVYKNIDKHREFLESSGALQKKRAIFLQKEIVNIIRDLSAEKTNSLFTQEHGQKILAAVIAKKLDPYTAAQKLFP